MGLLYLGIIFTLLLIIAKIVMGRRIDPAPEDLSDEDIIVAAREGKRIQAMKWYRILHSCSLKESKEAVENIIRKS